MVKILKNKMYRTCIICKERKEKGMHELKFDTLSICLCSHCLSDFADTLWKYLEEDNDNGR